MSSCPRSASTPLACSMTRRLFSAAQLDQQLDDVEVTDQGVGEGDESFAEAALALDIVVSHGRAILVALSVSLIVGPKP